jgi:hypothetical protein
MTRLVAVVLIVLTFLAPITAHAQSLRESIRHAAEAVALESPGSTWSEMPNGFKWTGIGLIGGGALFIVAGIAAGGEDCTTTTGPNFRQTICLTTDTTAIKVFGAIVAGTGAALLAIGAAKAHSTTIAVTPHGVTVRQSVPLPGRMFRSMNGR